MKIGRKTANGKKISQRAWCIILNEQQVVLRLYKHMDGGGR